MINGSKVTKIAIVCNKIQDGCHKKPMGLFFQWEHLKLFFLHILEFKKVGVIKSSGGAREVHLATRLLWNKDETGCYDSLKCYYIYLLCSYSKYVT